MIQSLMLQYTIGRRRAIVGSLQRSDKFDGEVTHVGIQDRGQIQTPYEKVVPHIILPW